MADLENLLLEAAGRNRHSRRRRRRRRRDGEYSDSGSDSKKDDSDYEHNHTDRAAKKDDKDLLGKIVSKRDKGKKTVSRQQTPPLTSSRVRRSTAKDDALNELRAKRLKQQDPEEQQRRLREAPRSSGPEHFSPKCKPLNTSTSLSSSSHSESESRSCSDDEDLTGDGGIIDSDDDRVMSGFEGPSFEDIKGITIPRSKLAKWFMEPFFEELIVGCFVRVGIGRSKSGPIYRLCMEEFKQWLKEVERSGGRMPIKKEVLEKKQAIQKINAFVYSAATVKQMLQEKKSVSKRPLNVAAEKDRLRTKLEIAESKHDEAEVERIKTRLQELKASRQAHEMDAKALKLAEMNRKNRFENFKNASELKPVNTGLKAGEAGYDPFSRRWTRSRNYYASKPGEEPAAGNNNAAGAVADTGKNRTVAAVTVEAGMVATAAALEAAAGAGKLVDTSAPVDEGTESNVLHNFELPISLAILQKFGGAKGAQAGVITKKQRIEAIVGFESQKMMQGVIR
ncbi:Plus3-like superfamily [Sesbania bispinosa]|nr:Plus3-like superfamily [Sesbania bispinosa]